MTQRGKKILLSHIIFFVTFFLCAYVVKELWFREDDLGQIINGIIRNWNDFLRVFSSDERDLIVPINYRRSNPNFISAFVRPLKNIFFTMVYYFHGLNVHAYYRLHVAVHALNAVLFFWLLNLTVPLSLAFFGGCMFAFFPDISWLVWIATFHNSLATLFLLLSLLTFYVFWKKKQMHIPARLLFLCSGCMLALSLLARENGIFYPFWITSGIFLFLFNPRAAGSFYTNVFHTFKKALVCTWIFYFVESLYVLMRVYLFGIETLVRTYNNLFLRFPWLAHYLKAPAVHADFSVQPSAHTSSVAWHSGAGSHLPTWLNILFPINSIVSNAFLIAVCWCILIFFLYCAYKKSKKLLLFFSIGIAAFIWPALLAYPSARYVNGIYPILIALFIVGISNLLYEKKRSRATTLLAYGMLCFLGVVTINNAYVNLNALKQAGASTVSTKQPYERFFNEHTFDQDTNFLIFSSPFVSDIQNIFHYFLHDYSIKVSCELFSTVAQQGSFGCHADYKVRGVQREILPIPSGYRIISRDKQHCACWMNFSNFPMWWVEKDKAYEWRKHLYKANTWYPCSMGKFKIHERLEDKYITDMSFIIDPKWVNKHTVVVTWDTMLGKYVILDSSHLKK